jgi:hypothetical protein
MRTLAKHLGCVILAACVSVRVAAHGAVAAVGAVDVMRSTQAPDNAAPRLPTLNWPNPVPADWLDVTVGCGGELRAVGDGVVDDTDAIQVRLRARVGVWASCVACPS